NSAGEEHADVAELPLREETLDLQLPKDEARPRSDVAAALASLEDEAACAFFEEEIQQPGGRHMEIRPRAVVIELARLRGAPACDDRVRRPPGAHDGDLFLAHALGDEAEDADAPRPIPEERLRLSQERFDLRALHEREREER